MGKIYGGFSGNLIDGDGVFAAMLKKKGIWTVSEEDYRIGTDKESV